MLSACRQEPLPSRAAWIQKELILENRAWIAREPEWVAAKFKKMVDDPYDFMRGSTRLFYLDLISSNGAQSDTRFLSSTGASSIMMIGDPHPENFGTLPGSRMSDGPVWGFNDLDAANFGPYTLDIRRLIFSIVQLGDQLPHCPSRCLAMLAERTVTGYLLELKDLKSGRSPSAMDSSLHHAVWREAQKGGSERKLFNKYVDTLNSGQMTLRRFEGIDSGDKSHRELSPSETHQVEELVDQFNRRLDEPVQVIDAVRRYGSGVNSLPAVRYVILVEQSSQPFLLEIRELSDPAPTGIFDVEHPRFDSNAHRVGTLSRHFWGASSDLHYSGLDYGSISFRVRGYSSWTQGFDHEKIIMSWNDQDIDLTDLTDFAEMLGRALAQVHSRGTTTNGQSALNVIVADINAGGPAEFIRECIRNAGTDLRRSTADRATLQWLINEYGPMLGADLAVEDF